MFIHTFAYEFGKGYCGVGVQGQPNEGQQAIKGNIQFAEAFIVWLKISLLSFGGPAGQIAVMHRLLVDELKWVSEKRFLHALNFCMLLPGPEAQQLTIYLGWLLHRVRGGVVAGVLFVLPGALTVLVLSMVYVTYQQAMAVNSIFFGVKAAVLAIVTTALWRLARKVLLKKFLIAITLSAFLASFVFAVPFPIVIVGAALAAFFFGEVPTQTDGQDEEGDGRAIDSRIAAGGSPKPHRALFVAVVCACLWLAPVACFMAGLVQAMSMFRRQCSSVRWRLLRLAGPMPFCPTWRNRQWGILVAQRWRNARWAWHGGNNTWATDHGHAVCWIHGCLSQPWRT